MRVGRGPLLGVWLAIGFDAPLVAAGLYRHSADVATHLFFADHYRRSWFGLWEPRWFGGFSVSSYPPLVHQLLALLSIPFGYDGAFAILLLATLIAFPVAVWRFATILVPPRAASAAAVAAVFLPGLALAEYGYGQLPTAVSLTITLFLVAEYVHFVESGGGFALALVASLAATAFAAHHATPVLFMPPALVAALSTVLLRGVDPDARALQVRRALLAAAATLLAATVVIAPFWLWASSGVHQASIPHDTRTSLLVDLKAQSLFVWGEYGILPALAIIGLWRHIDRRTIAVAVLAVFLGGVGLGGTTPIPALLFGPQWQWLTYDRFALWGAVALLPLAGIALNHLLSTRVAFRRALGIAALLVLFAYCSANAVISLSTAAGRDVRPIAEYLNAGRTQWRYQTFGIGNSATELGYLTSAATIDGSYYSARRLPELTSSGIGNLDAALWWDPTGRVLRRVLARADFYSIRWAFVGESRYDAYLAQAGFAPRGVLPGRIEVWENPGAPPVPAEALRFAAPNVAGILWGSLPLAFAILALGFAFATYRRVVPGSMIREQPAPGIPSARWPASLAASGRGT